jgi:hypothetical protein
MANLPLSRRGCLIVPVQNFTQGRLIAPCPPAEPEEDDTQQKEENAGNRSRRKNHCAKNQARNRREESKECPESQTEPP